MTQTSSLLPYLITALVVVAGWFVNSLLNRFEARRLHDERRDDMQKAIFAEIRAFVALQERNQLSKHRALLVSRIRQEDLVPFVIPENHDRVYRALLQDIHFLPMETIDDITVFFHTLELIARMQDSMQRPEFVTLEAGRRASIYEDYIAMIETALAQGKQALTYIRLFDQSGGAAVTRTKKSVERQQTELRDYEVKAWISKNQ